MNYGNENLRNVDRIIDRLAVNPPLAHAQGTVGFQNTSSEKGWSEERLHNMSIAAIKEYYRYCFLFTWLLFTLCLCQICIFFRNAISSLAFIILLEVSWKLCCKSWIMARSAWPKTDIADWGISIIVKTKKQYTNQTLILTGYINTQIGKYTKL